MKKRSLIDKKYKWDLSDYFSDAEKWESCYQAYEQEIEKIKNFNGKLKDRDSVLNCLRLLESLDLKAEPLYVYANSMHDLDITNNVYQEMLSKIENTLTKQSVETSFVTPQLTKLSKNFLKDLLGDNSFKPYRKVLNDIIREKEHVLGENEENLISNMGLFAGNFSDNFSNFENADLKFNDVLNKKGKALPMSEAMASMYLRDEDSVLRENAYVELNSAFGRFNNFLTSNYMGSVKKDVFMSRIRKFNSSLESALFYEEVSKNVYNTLINNVDKFLNLEHKYFDLKGKLLNLKPFKTCDVYFNPLKNRKKYTYEVAKNLVCDALGSVLGKDYIDGLNDLFDGNKIDVFPTKNKRNGAYETVAYGKSPIVLTNFNGNFDDVSTLAHELGHAMHSYYSNKSQTIFNAGYTIFLAEIASTVNETILNEYMLKNVAKTREEKLFFVNEFLSRFHATVFRQTMFAEFENLSHNLVEQNLPVSSKILNEKYLELVKKYFGKKVKVLDAVKYEWSRIPHFYTAFYVYKYATGIISAINIVENLKDGTISVDDYKRFLSSGCTNDPITLLKIVKVDLETDEPFIKAFKVFENYIKELKNLI